MATYRAPVADLRFALFDLLDGHSQYRHLFGEQAPEADTVDMVMAGLATFAEQVLQPLYRSGDEEGAHFDQGRVTLPRGYREAHAQYRQQGWSLMAVPAQWGGQGLPPSLSMLCNEFASATNPPWVMLTGLPLAVMATLDAHGSEQQKQQYFRPLASNEWGATMCLTEAHAGTDLGLIRTRAEARDDGSYRITGSKMFISYGEQDITDNIIHLVLAKLPDAPAGTAGISMFIVPRHLLDDDGSPGQRNAVSCGSIEHKMGYSASPTCVMNFDGATGWLVGNLNEGLKNMFTLMNNARIGSGMAALGLADASLQAAVSYARERLQMRSLKGPVCPEKPADPIIVHPGVRQMLMTQKALTEACRAFLVEGTLLAERSRLDPDPVVRKSAGRRLGLLTPIIKGFITEAGYECVNLGVQVMGGHGYMREHGMEQRVRDCRIATIYEGTTQVQALDLLGRKVLMNQGRDLGTLVQDIVAFCENVTQENLRDFAAGVKTRAETLANLTPELGMKALQNPDDAGAAAVDYLMYCGYVITGWYSLRAAVRASDLLASGDSRTAFLDAKIKTARYYHQRLLPRADLHLVLLKSGSDSVMAMAEEQFLVE